MGEGTIPGQQIRNSELPEDGPIPGLCRCPCSGFFTRLLFPTSAFAFDPRRGLVETPCFSVVRRCLLDRFIFAPRAMAYHPPRRRYHALCSLAVCKSCGVCWRSSPLQAHGGNFVKPHPNKKGETKSQALLSRVIRWGFSSTPDILFSLQLCHLFSGVGLIRHCNYPKAGFTLLSFS